MVSKEEGQTALDAYKREIRSLNREISALRQTNAKLTKKVDKIKPKRTQPPSQHSIEIGEIMKRPEIRALASSMDRMVEANRVKKAEASSRLSL